MSDFKSRQLLTYVEKNFVTNNVISGAGWVDWDLSGDVSSDAKLVELVVAPAITQQCGARQNGSSEERRTAVNQPITISANLDSAKIIEVYDSSAVNNTAYIMIGYWK